MNNWCILSRCVGARTENHFFYWNFFKFSWNSRNTNCMSCERFVENLKLPTYLAVIKRIFCFLMHLRDSFEVVLWIIIHFLVCLDRRDVSRLCGLFVNFRKKNIFWGSKEFNLAWQVDGRPFWECLLLF